ncbi:Protein of unknown function [Pyronema omphalodes CBS 100304]|uniref:Uncharacterized protein n=1 Tax=Pyronema omphalodes (strain CBS 100304) TaxID=1076935 RepID=U4LNP4_PYROM|nr:Protein of unknown function [Pyronema omphalodes CBS 100304]
MSLNNISDVFNNLRSRDFTPDSFMAALTRSPSTPPALNQIIGFATDCSITLQRFFILLADRTMQILRHIYRYPRQTATSVFGVLQMESSFASSGPVAASIARSWQSSRGIVFDTLEKVSEKGAQAVATTATAVGLGASRVWGEAQEILNSPAKQWWGRYEVRNWWEGVKAAGWS